MIPERLRWRVLETIAGEQELRQRSAEYRAYVYGRELDAVLEQIAFDTGKQVEQIWAETAEDFATGHRLGLLEDPCGLWSRFRSSVPRAAGRGRPTIPWRDSGRTVRAGKFSTFRALPPGS
jgi:hypothetical protein